MKLQTNFTVSGKAVENIGKVSYSKQDKGHITIYEDQTTSFDSTVLFLISDDGEVLGSIRINCDMCQGSGYVSSIDINNIL